MHQSTPVSLPQSSKQKKKSGHSRTKQLMSGTEKSHEISEGITRTKFDYYNQRAAQQPQFDRRTGFNS